MSFLSRLFGRPHTLPTPAPELKSAVDAPPTTDPMPASAGWKAEMQVFQNDGLVGAETNVNGVKLRDYSGNAAAEDAATQILSQLTQRPDVSKRLKQHHVELVIIPATRKLTDIPEFKHLKGKKTFDGRPWEAVRGAGAETSGNHIAVGAPEESLVNATGNAYGKFSVTTHELAHAIEREGISSDERRSIRQAFGDQVKAGGPWTETYGSSNEEEFFAQGTTAWFGRNDGMGNNGADWVRQNQPKLATILQSLYGDPPADPKP